MMKNEEKNIQLIKQKDSQKNTMVIEDPPSFEFEIFLDVSEDNTNEKKAQQILLNHYLKHREPTISDSPMTLQDICSIEDRNPTDTTPVIGIRTNTKIVNINDSPRPIKRINSKDIPTNVTISEVEVVQHVIYCESEEIIRYILNNIIANMPTISQMAFSIKKLDESHFEYPYYTREEVVVHNKPADCWVSYLGYVYDLTPLVKLHEHTSGIRPILAFAGKDISNWFDEATGDLRYYIHPITGVRVPYLPYGSIPDIQPDCPATRWAPVCSCDCKDPYAFVPWWRDDKYKIGRLTERTRPIRIINTLTLDECTLNVCKEDKLSRILERLKPFNSQATSYTWKYHTRVLDMNKTLDENGIPDERDKFVDLFLPETIYIPAILLYYNDDFIYDDDSDESIN